MASVFPTWTISLANARPSLKENDVKLVSKLPDFSYFFVISE